MPETRDRTLTVIGSTSVGKSSLTIRFLEGRFSAEYDPTISRMYRHRQLVNGVDYSLTIYDTAGLEQQAQIPQQYIKSHGFILVYSINDPQSFKIVSDIYIRLVDELGSTQIPIVLIGNKTDLNEQRRITYEAGKDLVQQWKDAGSQAAFMETSALTGEKVSEVFTTLINLMDPTTNQGKGNSHHQANSVQTSNNQVSNHSHGGKKEDKKCIIS